MILIHTKREARDGFNFELSYGTYDILIHTKREARDQNANAALRLRRRF